MLIEQGLERCHSKHQGGQWSGKKLIGGDGKLGGLNYQVLADILGRHFLKVLLKWKVGVLPVKLRLQNK